MIWLFMTFQLYAQSSVRPYVGLGLHFSTADRGRSENPILVQSGQAQRESATFRAQPAFGAALEAGYSRPWRFGVFGGLEAETGRRLGGSSANVTSASLQTAIENSNLHLGTIYVNLAYAFDWFFVFIGHNYSHVRLSSPDDTTPTAVGLLGFQTGAGCFITQDWLATLAFRRETLKLEWRSGADYIDTQTLNFDGLQLGVRYAFY